MAEWHLIKTLPKFYKNETNYVEVMLRNGMTEIACFKKDQNGTVYCDTGYSLIDMENIVKWKNIDLF